MCSDTSSPQIYKIEQLKAVKMQQKGAEMKMQLVIWLYYLLSLKLMVLNHICCQGAWSGGIGKIK